MARILAIDDDAVTRATIRTFLEWKGHEVMEAPDGEAGLKLQHECPPDVIITDLAMPKLDGIGIIVRVRREHPTIGIVVISGKGSYYLSKARLLGADKTLSKPFRLQELLEAVEELIS
ncbi:MAG: response regulator [Desulfobacteraceae bacterium]|nr:MAG: response regulator [Desulfobacteraceae bacterium]